MALQPGNGNLNYLPVLHLIPIYPMRPDPSSQKTAGMGGRHVMSDVGYSMESSLCD
jgi:hypothetical protein